MLRAVYVPSNSRFYVQLQGSTKTLRPVDASQVMGTCAFMHRVLSCTLCCLAPCAVVHLVLLCTLCCRAPCAVVHRVLSCTVCCRAPCAVVHRVLSCTLCCRAPWSSSGLLGTHRSVPKASSQVLELMA